MYAFQIALQATQGVFQVTIGMLSLRLRSPRNLMPLAALALSLSLTDI